MHNPLNIFFNLLPLWYLMNSIDYEFTYFLNTLNQNTYNFGILFAIIWPLLCPEFGTARWRKLIKDILYNAGYSLSNCVTWIALNTIPMI